MSLAAQQLRKRVPIRNSKVEKNQGSHQRELTLIHDTYTVAYNGLSCVANELGFGAVLIPLLYLIDIAWLEYGHDHYHRSQMKRLYQMTLLTTAILAACNGEPSAFRLNIIGGFVPVLFIAHRSNKGNTVLELLWVVSWLVCKLALTWISTFLYVNEAGRIYSYWATFGDRSPLENPWTNPPAILIALVSFIASCICMVQSYYVMGSGQRLI